MLGNQNSCQNTFYR